MTLASALRVSLASGVTGCEFSAATGAPTTGHAGVDDTTSTSSGSSVRADDSTGSVDTSTTAVGVAGETTHVGSSEGGSSEAGSSEGGSSGTTAATTTGEDGEGIVTSLYCDSPGAAIPDDDGGGVATTIVVPDAGAVLGVRVQLGITHTHVGDLRLDLRHGKADRLLVSYPGGGGCSGDDILARLTDEAQLTVQTACTADTPALSGDLVPEFSLEAFLGLPMLGSWELRATDGAPADTGTIVAWCLEIDHLP